MVFAVTEVATLIQWANWTFAGHVVTLAATIEAPDFCELLLAERMHAAAAQRGRLIDGGDTRRLPASLSSLAFDLHVLAGVERSKAGHLQHRLVCEDVFATVVGSDEAEALQHIEPLAMSSEMFQICIVMATTCRRRATVRLTATAALDRRTA